MSNNFRILTIENDLACKKWSQFSTDFLYEEVLTVEKALQQFRTKHDPFMEDVLTVKKDLEDCHTDDVKHLMRDLGLKSNVKKIPKSKKKVYKKSDIKKKGSEKKSKILKIILKIGNMMDEKHSQFNSLIVTKKKI
jgi:hypothetical protein